MSVLCYWPNLIGYLRITFLFYGLSIALESPLLGFSFLGVSILMDGLDGFLARRLNQTSKFGAILDYALDRATVGCIFILLSMVYPKYWVWFALFLTLDVLAHFFHLQASQLKGKKSHKEQGSEEPFLIRLYYSNKFTLTMVCLTHDLCLGAFFLHAFFPNLFLWTLFLIMIPGFLFKTAVHVNKIIRSSEILIQEST